MSGLTLSQMRALVRRGAGGLSDSDLGDSDLDLYLNMAFWELENKFPFKEKECLVTSETVAGQELYEVPGDIDAIISISIVDDDLSYKLTRMGFDQFDEIRTEDSDSQGRPEKYLRRDNAIVLYPVPDDVYTIRLLMWKNLASLLEGTVDAPDLPRNWHELVVEGAIQRVHFYSEDYNLAQQAASLTMGKIRSAVPTEAKEERDSRYAGLKVAWDEPDGRQ